MTHSIPESSSILIKTQNGNIFHTGDWKIDPKPLVGDPIDDSNLKVKLKDKVDIMICDSTNVFEPKPSGSEGEVRDNLRKIFSQHHNGKIVITCFASNIARIESIIKASEESDKCCLLLGRSLRRIYESAQENNLLTNFKNIITEKEAKMLPDENLVIICTGSQGEKRAALSRVVNNNHKFLDLNKKDLLIFSSREIPGNEKRINNVKSIAKKRGCTLLDHTNSKVHVSGHPSKEELGKMYDWVSPDLLIPVHGEYRHLEEQIKFSKESGIKKQILVENGDLVILDRGIDRKIIGKVESGRTVLKGNKLIPLNDKFLSNLDLINSDGEVFINIILDLKDNLMTDPVIFCPSVPIDDNVKSELKLLISKNFDEMCNNSFDDNILCDQIKTNVRSFFKNKIELKPLTFIEIVRI
jgi:ribonuclease J